MPELEKENKAIAQEYKELLRISYQTLTLVDKKLIRKAFDVAVDAHKDQRRKSGEAYIFHPIAVAKIVKSFIYWTLTDAWGDIPYSQALQGAGNLTPKFDKQEDIYFGMLKELKEAVNGFDGITRHSFLPNSHSSCIVLLCIGRKDYRLVHKHSIGIRSVIVAAVRIST